MGTKEEVEDQKSLLATYRRNLAIFRRQQAEFGAITPPHIVHGTAEARQQIERIKLILRQWDVDVEDHPDDSETPNEEVQWSRSRSIILYNQQTNQSAVFILDRTNWTIFKVIVIGVCAVGILGLFATIYRSWPLASLASGTVFPTAELKNRDDWPLVFRDDFEVANTSWVLSEDKDSITAINRYISNGKLVWEVEAKKLIFAANGPATDQTSDFSLAVDVIQVDGLRTIPYGLYFRGRPGEDLYSFTITNNQYWSFFINHNNEWIPIVDWSKTNSIRPKESNKLRVVAEGERFTFFINEEYVGKGVDSRLKVGEVGIGVSVEGTEAVRFEFDNFELRAPTRK